MLKMMKVKMMKMKMIKFEKWLYIVAWMLAFSTVYVDCRLLQKLTMMPATAPAMSCATLRRQSTAPSMNWSLILTGELHGRQIQRRTSSSLLASDIDLECMSLRRALRL